MLGVPLIVACAAENATVQPPMSPQPTASATATETATATATASASASASASETATASASATGDTGANDAGAGASADGGVPAQYRACTMDSDCVAVPRVGCCKNGWMEAVATSQQSAYAASFTCPQAHPICPMYRVRDSRVALCDNAAHLCTMEKPEDVHCGGFVRNAHQCPTGYTCPRSKVPDVASICVKSP